MMKIYNNIHKKCQKIYNNFNIMKIRKKIIKQFNNNQK